MEENAAVILTQAAHSNWPKNFIQTIAHPLPGQSRNKPEALLWTALVNACGARHDQPISIHQLWRTVQFIAAARDRRAVQPDNLHAEELRVEQQRIAGSPSLAPFPAWLAVSTGSFLTSLWQGLLLFSRP